MADLTLSSNVTVCPFCQRSIRVSDAKGVILEHFRPRLPGSPWPIGCPGGMHTPRAAAKLAALKGQ